MRSGKSRLLEDLEDDDPILSVVNLIDVFLVIIAALLLAVANSPVNPFSSDTLTVIRNAGQPNMEIMVKNHEKLGEGHGTKAGVAYRMKDGSMVYVPEN